MTTELQRRANRANALKSTGPRSTSGKAAVRLNAVRHGLLSRVPVMVGEDRDEYAALCEQLEAELKPVGIIETQLVSRIAGCLWRLRRLSHIEAGLLSYHAAGTYAEAAETVAASYTRTEGGMQELLDNLNGERVIVLDEAAYNAANEVADEARAARLTESALLGAAYQTDADGADALTKLARYEVMLERSLYRARAELRQIQQLREQEDEARQRQERRSGVEVVAQKVSGHNDVSSGE